jgi:hypothetical protein
LLHAEDYITLNGGWIRGGERRVIDVGYLQECTVVWPGRLKLIYYFSPYLTGNITSPPQIPTG